MKEDNEWPSQLEDARRIQEDREAERESKPQFDFISRFLTYVVGFGLAIVLIAVFARLVLWILGFNV